MLFFVFEILKTFSLSISASGGVFDLKKYSSIFVVPNFMYVFGIKIVSAIPLGVLQAMFSIVAMDYFHLDAKNNGLVLSYVGVIGMVKNFDFYIRIINILPSLILFNSKGSLKIFRNKLIN